MFLFEDLFRMYPRHVRDHNLVSGCLFVATALAGKLLSFSQPTVFWALLCLLICGTIYRIPALQREYTGGFLPKHALGNVVGVFASALILLFAYSIASNGLSSGYKKLALAFIITNFLRTYLAVGIVHFRARMQKRG